MISRVLLFPAIIATIFACNKEFSNKFSNVGYTCGNLGKSTYFAQVFYPDGNQLDTKEILSLWVEGKKAEFSTSSQGCLGWVDSGKSIVIASRDRKHLFSGPIEMDSSDIHKITLSELPIIDQNRSDFESWLLSICPSGTIYSQIPTIKIPVPGFLSFDQIEHISFNIFFNGLPTSYETSLANILNKGQRVIRLKYDNEVNKVTFRYSANDKYDDHTSMRSCEIITGTDKPKLTMLQAKPYFRGRYIQINPEEQVTLDYFHSNPIERVDVKFINETTGKELEQSLLPLKWNDENQWKAIIPFPFNNGKWITEIQAYDIAGNISDKDYFSIDLGKKLYLPDEVSDINISETLAKVFVTAKDGVLRSYDLMSHELINEFDFDQPLSKIKEFGDTKLLVLGENTLFIYDTQKNTIVNKTSLETVISQFLTNSAFDQIILLDLGGNFYLLDVFSHSKLGKPYKVSSIVNRARWISNSQILLSKTNGNVEIINSTDPLNAIFSIKACEFPQAMDSVIDIDSGLITTACSDGYMKVINTKNTTIQTSSLLVNSSIPRDIVEISKNSDEFIVTDSKGNLFLIDSLQNLIDGNINKINGLKHSATLTSTKLSPERRYLLTSSEDKTASLYDLKHSTQLTLVNHAEVASSIAYDSVNNQLFTGSLDGIVKIVNPTKILAKKKLQGDISNAIYLENHNKIVVAHGMDYNIKLSILDHNYQTIFSDKVHDSYVNSLSYIKEENLLLTASEDQSSKILAMDDDITQFTEDTKLIFDQPVHLVDTNGTYQVALVGAKAFVYKTDSSTSFVQSIENNTWLDYGAFIEGSNYLGLGGSDGIFHLYDPESNKVLLKEQISKNSIAQFSLSSDRKTIAFVSWDGYSYIYSINLEEPKITFINSYKSSLGNYASGFAGNEYLISLSWNQSVMVIKKSDSTSYLIDCINEPLKKVSIDPSEEFMAISTESGKAYIFEIKSGKPIQIISHNSTIQYLNFLDRDKVLSLSEDGTLIETKFDSFGVATCL